MKSKGFTLIELLVVVAIIGILATVVLASLGSARTRARTTQVTLQLKETEKGLFAAAIDEGRNSYWTQADLGAASQTVNLSTMLAISSGSGATISNYLNSGHATWSDGSNVQYRNAGGTLGSCSDDLNGVFIYIPYTWSSAEAQEINDIIDGADEVTTNCGRVRTITTTGLTRYMLSLNSSQLDY